MNDSEYLPKFDAAVDHFRVELGQVRTGRATPALVENIKVGVYDTYMPILELASISVPEPRSLLIAPWDKTIIDTIAKGINEAGLGLNCAVDGENIRINIPPLTEERRAEFVKLVAQKAELAKVTIRQVRHDMVEEIKKSKEKGEIGVDEEARLLESADEKVGEYNNKIDTLKDVKSEEIMTV